MDKRDEIIAAQLELIREMTERNIRRLSDDIRRADIGVSKAKDTPVEKSAAVETTADVENCAVVGKIPDDNSEDIADTTEPIEKLLAELDTYIGLERVKREVQSLINTARIYKLRRDGELPTVDTSLHMVFSGNPGTGKTMIARFMARVYRSLGLLSKGHLVECDRSSLVAGFVGQTAQKTAEVLKSALGGVLFIDEAYSLTASEGQDYGPEAVDTILKYMEDHRDDIVVIVAGYGDLMDDFIDSNPGLRSRFNNYIFFDDYSPEELMQIFNLNLSRGLYKLGNGAEKLLCEYFSSCAENAADFGNARGVRNTFERVLRAQADRLAAVAEPSRDELTLITREDIAAAIYPTEELP